MSKHIKFEGLGCKDLQYVKAGNCWVCLDLSIELNDVDFCFRCKFSRQLERERLIMEGKLDG